MKKYKVKAILTLIVVLSIFFGGCATRIVALPGPSRVVNARGDTVTLEKAGLIVRIRILRWTYRPGEVNKYFTPFYVAIKNTLDREIEIKLENFVLLDEETSQYKAIPPAEVALLLSGPYFPFIPGDLIRYSFREGKIFPFAQGEGFIFFQKVTERMKKLKMFIVFKGIEAGKDTHFEYDFERRAAGEHPK